MLDDQGVCIRDGLRGENVGVEVLDGPTEPFADIRRAADEFRILLSGQLLRERQTRTRTP